MQGQDIPGVKERDKRISLTVGSPQSWASHHTRLSDATVSTSRTGAFKTCCFTLHVRRIPTEITACSTFLKFHWCLDGVLSSPCKFRHGNSCHTSQGESHWRSVTRASCRGYGWNHWDLRVALRLHPATSSKANTTCVCFCLSSVPDIGLMLDSVTPTKPGKEREHTWG